MKELKIASGAIVALTFIGSIVIGRDWLISGGGDWPAFAVWSLLCLAVGFGLAAIFADRSLERRVDKRIEKNIATDDEVRDRLRKTSDGK